MKKILIIKSALTYGGVDQLVLNLLSIIDFDKYSVDIQYFKQAKNTDVSKYAKYPCKLIPVDRVRSGILRFMHEEYQVFSNGKYDVVHSHTSEINALIIIIAKLAGVRKLVVHSHYDEYPQIRTLMPVFHFIYRHSKTIKVACSRKAGISLYGDNVDFIFLKNGIDTKKFSYNEVTRRKVRDKLELSDKFVVGYVARMIFQKNHKFLIEVFEKVIKEKKDAVLLLVGSGELENDVKSQVSKLGLTKNVIMLGNRDDVDDLLMAMDVIVFPTRYEGLSMSLLEIQCAGLKCICSDVIPQEAVVSENMILMSLGEGTQAWADKIIDNAKYVRIDGSKLLREAGFDKITSAESTIELYN